MMKAMRNLGAFGALLVAAAGAAANAPAGRLLPASWIESHERTAEFLSPYYDVDRIYRSMKGPRSTEPVSIEGGPPELLWITGYSADVVGDFGDPSGLEQFMCHSNLDVEAADYAKRFGVDHAVSSRLFTVSQGQMDLEFPPGFGIPVLSNERLSLTTQVLNLNYEMCDLRLRHRTRIRYVRDRDLPFAMTPLYERAVYGLKLLDGADGRYGMDPQARGEHGAASCLPGQNADTFEYHDAYGRVFTGHWVVPPGREVDRTPVDAMLALKRDVVVHYIAVHMHPFARSLELWDATDRCIVWKAEAENSPVRIGLDRVDTYSSPEGLALQAAHHYELISIYDNTTAQPQDSMAVMYLYVEDPDFRKPEIPSPGAAVLAAR
jgi:hypothetical protein